MILKSEDLLGNINDIHTEKNFYLNTKLFIYCGLKALLVLRSHAISQKTLVLSSMVYYVPHKFDSPRPVCHI